MSEVVDLVFDIFEQVGVGKDDVRFIYLFGSSVDDVEAARDIDVCISVDSEDLEVLEQRINGRVPEKYHFSIFENLPLQVKNQVFKGELLYRRDKSVYDEALKTFREFESFKPHYEEIIGV